MRISHFFIDGFGIFHNVSVRDLPPGLTLFVGDNETGKSTCLSFLRDILFGFRDKRFRENDHPPLAGGRQGGNITVVSDHLGEAVIERRPGKKGGSVTVTYVDGRKGAEEALGQLLGGTTRDLFRNIYAFSLSELQTIDTLSDEAVKSVLYSAGTGTAMLSLPKAITSIEAKLGELFKPGGRNPKINQKLVALEIVRARLREARKGIELYDAASMELDKKVQEIEVLQSEERSIGKERNRTETYLKLWNNWISIQDSERELSQLPLVVDNFPENGIERLDRELERLAREKELLIDLTSDRDNLSREIKDIFVDEKILGESAAIRTLLDKKESYISAVENVPVMSGKLGYMKRGILNILNGLGEGWTEESVTKVDRSLFTREAILKQQELLNRARSNRKETEHFVESKEDEYRAAERAESQAQKDFERHHDIHIEADDNTILSLQKGRDQFASVVRDLPQRIKELEDARGELDETIKEIEPDWTETDILAFDCSVPAQQAVQSYESILARAEQDCAQAEMKIESARTELRNAQEQYNAKARELEKMEQMPVAALDELTNRKSALRTLKGCLFECDTLAAEMGHHEERLSDKRQEMMNQGQVPTEFSMGTLKGLALAAAIIGLVLGIILSIFVTWAVGVAAGGILAVVGGIIFFVYRYARNKWSLQAADKHSHLAEIEQQVSALEAQLPEIKKQHAELSDRIVRLANKLGMHPPVRPGDVDSLEARVEEEIRISDNKKRLADEVETLKSNAVRSGQSMEDLVKIRDGSDSTLQKAKDDWGNHLKRLGLRTGATPRTVNLIFTKIETAKTRIKHIYEIQRRIDQMEEARNEYLSYAKDVPSLAVLTERGLTGLLSGVDLFLERSRETEKKLHEKRLAEQLLEEKKSRKRETENDLQDARGRHEEAVNNEEEVRESWQNWLTQRGFDQELSPATTLEAFQKIEECIRLTNESSELTKQIRDKKDAIEEYLRLATGVFERLGELTPETQALMAGIDKLGEGLDEAKTNLARREELTRKIPGIKAKIAASGEKILRIEKDIDKLIRLGGAEDQEAFRTRGRYYSERANLVDKIAQEERSLKIISGEEDIASLKESLKNLDIGCLRTTQDELSERLQLSEGKLNDCRQEKANLLQQISALTSADEISRLRAEEEGLLEEIRLLSMDWGCYAIAKFLLSEARRRFEQEQQPKVIHDAGMFFQTITEGRYQKIIAPIGEDTIDVITPDGERRRPEELSRGAAEQLYLAIRFGYISNYSVNGENLPIIMDDILVNFDPKRARQTASTILKLAATHQVLFFTCHPETVAIFKGYNENTPVYVLHDGTIFAGKIFEERSESESNSVS